MKVKVNKEWEDKNNIFYTTICPFCGQQNTFRDPKRGVPSFFFVNVCKHFESVIRKDGVVIEFEFGESKK